jgi:hypothetical protein
MRSVSKPRTPRSERSSAIDATRVTAVEPAGSKPDAHHPYSARLAERSANLERLRRSDDRLGTLRLLLAAIFLGALWRSGRGAIDVLWPLLPAALFAGCVLYHRRILARLREVARSVKFYQCGLDRLSGAHPTAGPDGSRFLDLHHIYAADLDVFGRHSLYARLCTARTTMGEDTLAGWLLAPADRDAILERQACVRELRDRLDLRERFAVLGEPEHITLDPARLAGWAKADGDLPGSWVAGAAWLLVAAAAATAALWGGGGPASPFLAVLTAEAALLYGLRHRVQTVLSGVEHAHASLRLVAVLLARIEAESFAAPALGRLRAALSSAGLPASASLDRLATIVNFVEARRNPFLSPLLTPLLYPLHTALAAERWRRRHGRSVATWLAALGEFEALQSLAAYSAERPADPFPEFLPGAAAFDATALGHPLIPADRCVRNDVTIGGETRALMVSGSNMSGKSTLLRAVGINTVLAMAGAPVCATRLQLAPLQVGASIRGGDSLQEGSSRFYAEITRLRRLFEPCALPLLFLLDELLQGTNSSDRQIGAHGVLKALIARGAIGIVSTHDLRLGDDAGLGAALCNVHFQDELEDGKLSFDFKLRDGVVTKSNGVELMRAIGLDV